jgi:hypothetical protein
MLDLAISVDTDRNGTPIIETNHGVRMKAPEWFDDCEFQLVAYTPSAKTCQIISAEELAGDIRQALAALENVGVLKPRKADWYRRLRRYAEGAGTTPTE